MNARLRDGLIVLGTVVMLLGLGAIVAGWLSMAPGVAVMVVGLLVSFGAVGYWAWRQGESLGRVIAGLGALVAVGVVMALIALLSFRAVVG